MIFFALLAASSSLAAEVIFEGNKEIFVGVREARFHLKREITPADVGHVKEAIANTQVSAPVLGIAADRKIVISLDSLGGAYQAGLDLAFLFLRFGIATEVRSGESCYSACAVAFLGGSAPPKDPTPPREDGPLPNTGPDRSIANGAKLGFHAPYLETSQSSYDAQAVEDAYRAAVLGIARLIAISDHIHVSPAELPRLITPAKDEMYMVDTVDAVGMLGIHYTGRTLTHDLRGFTPSMIASACINRYYHLQRRSSIRGYPIAAAAKDEFVEGSKLLANGEENLLLGSDV
jgi:hypothetical protein